VARGSKAETGKEAPPSKFAEGPPSYADTVSSAWLIESLMQMQQAVGELKSDVKHLSAASEKQSRKLDRISHIIFAAGVVLVILLSVGGFFLNKIWDGVFTLITQQSISKMQTPPQNPPPSK
jgi:hypothetical protein